MLDAVSGQSINLEKGRFVDYEKLGYHMDKILADLRETEIYNNNNSFCSAAFWDTTKWFWPLNVELLSL